MKTLRKDFDTMYEHYLDNASTTKPCVEAVDAVVRCLTEDYGNPSSLHAMGLNAQRHMDHARESVAKALGCTKDSIVFTSGATESSNIAVLGTARLYGRRRKRVVTTTVEHASVRECFNELERQGYEVVRVAPDSDGEVSAESLINAVDANTCLVSAMLVNNETGYVLPIAKAFGTIKKRFPETVTHCDCVQGFLKLPISVRTLKADLVSISGHKVHAPKGVGALYAAKGIRVAKTNLGGKQERGFRSGTEALPSIAGFGAAVDVLYPTVGERFEHVSNLKRYLLDSVSTLDWVTVNSKSDASPYIVNLSVEGVRSETMLHFLESKGVYVSSGSACSKGAQSGVLGEFGLSDRLSDSAIRVSFCETDSTDDVDAFVAALREGFDSILKS